MSATTTQTPNSIQPRYEGLRLSREKYLDLDEDGFQYDMVDGVLNVSPSHDANHTYSQGEYHFQLRSHLQKSPTGRLFVELDVLLPDGGDVLRPDISYVSNERMDIVARHIHGAPDLVCEVLSDSTASRDLGEKSERYLNTGVREYWIVDPRDKSARVRYNRDGKWEEVAGAELKSEILKGLVIKVADLFVQA